MLKAIPGVEFPFTGDHKSLGLLSSVVKNGVHAKRRKGTHWRARRPVLVLGRGV